MCDLHCENSDLCELMNVQSKETWDRIGFARTHEGMKIFETTITQNIIYNIVRQNLSSIQIFEASDEKTNGNDIELIIKNSGEYYYYPAQAKIIYKQGRYDRIKHKDQILSLINYARENFGFPLYLLYNYYPNWQATFEESCTELLTPENFGCTVVPATHILEKYTRYYETGIFNWTLPRFNKLHNHFAKPWCILACCNRFTWDSVLKNVEDLPLIPFPKYKIIEQQNYWIPIHLKKGFFKEKGFFSKQIRSESNEFKPMFRVVIG